MSRKPWEVPVQYNDDRWDEDPPASQKGDGFGRRHGSDVDDEVDADADERDGRDIDELLARPDQRNDKEYECTDTTPVDYNKGPHDDEFGVDDSDFDTPDDHPVPYANQPHDDVFGLDDEDED